MSSRPPSTAVLDGLARRGDHAAVEQLTRPWSNRPDAPVPVQRARAEALLQLGLGPLAVQAWHRLVGRAPVADHLTGLGRALLLAQRPLEALPILLRAVTMGASPEVLATAAVSAPDHPTVRQALEVARRLHPNRPEVPLALARVAERAGNLDDAAAHLEAVLVRHPDHPEALLRLASVLDAVGQLTRARDLAERACRALPQHVEPLRVAAVIATRQGEWEHAAELLDRAIALAPEHPGLLWARARVVPAIPASEAEEQAAVATYDARLRALHTLADRTLATHPADWLHAVQDAFSVHYAGGDCLDRQALHGRMFERIAAAVVQVPPPTPPHRLRRRVGFVSSLFRRHTITKLFHRWMTDLDRDEFEVVAYHLGAIEDTTTEHLKRSVDLWRSAPGGVLQAVPIIAADAPDVLIFPELGMDARVLLVAALRLAPRQAVSWGHPVTTGLSTIDTFLACEAMGVAPDRRWTVEDRLDLPGIGITYTRPSPAPAIDRDHFGLPPDRPLLLCVQSLQKYRPAHDHLYARLAAALPDALFLFVSAPGTRRTERLQDRLAGVFAEHQLDLPAHVRFLPRLSEADWMGLLSLGDLFLDSPEWSGGNTTLEAVSVGLPCIAWPGTTFRGRHCLGINRELGLGELCPPDEATWLQATIELVQSPERRTDLRRRILAAAPRLFDDPRPTRALADWLRSDP